MFYESLYCQIKMGLLNVVVFHILKGGKWHVNIVNFTQSIYKLQSNILALPLDIFLQHREILQHAGPNNSVIKTDYPISYRSLRCFKGVRVGWGGVVVVNFWHK